MGGAASITLVQAIILFKQNKVFINNNCYRSATRGENEQSVQ